MEEFNVYKKIKGADMALEMWYKGNYIGTWMGTFQKNCISVNCILVFIAKGK